MVDQCRGCLRQQRRALQPQEDDAASQAGKRVQQASADQKAMLGSALERAYVRNSQQGFLDGMFAHFRHCLVANLNRGVPMLQHTCLSVCCTNLQTLS